MGIVIGFRFESGDAVEIDGLLHDVVSQDKEAVDLVALGGARSRRRLTNEEFWTLYREAPGPNGRRLVVRRGLLGKRSKVVAGNLDEPLADFDPAAQDEAMRRHAYVVACDRIFADDTTDRRGLYPKRPEGFARIAREVAAHRQHMAALAEGKEDCQIALEVVGGPTLRDWYWRWIDSGRDIRALLPCDREKGCYGSRLDGEVVQIVGRNIQERYLIEERPDASVVYDLVADEITQVNKGRVVPLKTPSYRTFLRCIEASTTPYDRTRLRRGEKTAANLYRMGRRAPLATRPLEVVEIDHTRLDVLLTDEDGALSKGDRRRKDSYEVWLTIARCQATKMIFGFHVGRERPSYVSVMNTISMGVLEKRLEGVNVQSPWPVFGVPEVLKMDNGAEFHSRSIRAMAGQLAMELRYMPRGKGHVKGMVEKTQDVVNRDFLAFTPGKLFNNPQTRGDYFSHGKVALTMTKLREMLTIYIVDILHNKPMGALMGRTPLQAWESLSGFHVRMPPSADELIGALATTIERTVTNVGVTYLGLVYQSRELQLIRRRKGHMGQKLMVKVDANDLGAVLVLEEGDGEHKGRWISVPCEYPELADGVSLVEWRETVSLARDRTEEGRRIALGVLRKARKLLSDEAARLSSKPKKVRQVDIDWARRHANDPAFDVAPENPDDANPVRRGRGRPRKNPPATEPGVVGDGGHEPAETEAQWEATADSAEPVAEPAAVAESFTGSDGGDGEADPTADWDD